MLAEDASRDGGVREVGGSAGTILRGVGLFSCT